MHPLFRKAVIFLAVIVVAITIMLLVIRGSIGVGTDVLKRFVPLEAFHDVSIKLYHRKALSKYPQYAWLIQFDGLDKGALLKAGFKQQDSDELKYVQNLIAAEFPDTFAADSDDLLLGKETDQFDASVLLKSSKAQGFVFVLKH